MARKIFRSGNSTVVSIPPEVLELLDLDPGDEVNVAADPERRRIVVTPTEAASVGEARDIRLRLGELMERYGPALERLAEIEERERAAAARGIDADALRRARALRDAFAVRHGVLSLDLVQAARADRQAQHDPAPACPGEG
ncbi:MAG: AbrB/MazE/SpoVT family DNA-binding domain-containing protein [Chloroflexota bacterium]